MATELPKFPADFGPIYQETVEGRFPIEPWNTYSNLIFLALILRYAYVTRLDLKRHPVIVISLPILLIGFIGGTIYHATRSHNVWLFMDFIPIALLVLGTTTALWAKVLGLSGWISFALILLALGGLRRLPWLLGFERAIAISLNYAFLGLLLLMPALIHSRQRDWKDVRFVLWAGFVFAFAVTFRLLDGHPQLTSVLPMGSHFLWHLFGGVSVGCLMEYIFRNLAREK